MFPPPVLCRSSIRRVSCFIWIFLFIFLIVAWPELPVLLAVLKNSRALLFCSPVIFFSLLSLYVLLSLIWYHTLLRKPGMCILRTGAFRLEHCACFIKEALLYTPWCAPHTCAHIHKHFRQDLPAFPPRQTFSSQHLLYIYTYIECHIRPVIWKPQKKKKKSRPVLLDDHGACCCFSPCDRTVFVCRFWFLCVHVQSACRMSHQK